MGWRLSLSLAVVVCGTARMTGHHQRGLLRARRDSPASGHHISTHVDSRTHPDRHTGGTSVQYPQAHTYTERDVFCASVFSAPIAAH